MEGQGVVLLEALVYGLPVIATNHSAFPETVLDKVSGFLVPQREADALAERLEYFIANPQSRPQIGKSGRQRVEQQYDIKVLNQRLAQIYMNLY